MKIDRSADVMRGKKKKLKKRKRERGRTTFSRTGLRMMFSELALPRSLEKKHTLHNLKKRRYER